jgi:hypothetical protein
MKMRYKYNVRIPVLLLIMSTAYAAVWSQNGWGRAINFGRGGNIQTARPAEATPVASGPQKATDKPAQSSTAAPGSPQESAKGGVIPIPIAPFIMEYQHGNLYFTQTIDDNPDYTRIDALLQDGPLPVHQASLTEKEGSRVVYYTNSEARARFLEASGKTAHVTPVDYKVEKSLGEQSKYTITFKDKKGRLIRWLFIPSADPDESKNGTAQMPQPLKMIYWVKAVMAGEGTAVQIDNTTSRARELPDLSNPPWYTAYSGNIFIDAIIGGPVSGSQNWQVKTAPTVIAEGAKWILTDGQNNTRQLKVVAKRGNEITIQEVEVNPSVSAPMTLVMKETPEGLSLSSSSFSDGTRSLRLTFTPALNIAGVSRSGKKSSVSFQMDIGSEGKVIEGVLEAERKGDSVELTGRPNSPEGAKKIVLKSNVTLSEAGYKIDSLNTASAELTRTSLKEKQ